MKYSHIVQLEANLERFVESTFAHLFGATMSANDVAVALGRALEQQIKWVSNENPPIAPNIFTVTLHPDIIKQLDAQVPNYQEQFIQHIIDIVTRSGYQLLNDPQVHFVKDDQLLQRDIKIEAKHQNLTIQKTASMQPVLLPQQSAAALKAQLVINNKRTVDLNATLYRIGRAVDNDIVIEDKYLSRYHLQIRLRQGAHTLFDIQNKGGTRVNQLPVREHRLQAGDVIHVGQTMLLYLADGQSHNRATQTTDSIPPVHGDSS